MRNNIVGFTLIELLVTLSIASIIACFSVALNQQLMAKQQLKILLQELVIMINYSRNLALLNHQDLLLTCLNSNKQQLQLNCLDGMMLIVDNKIHKYTQKSMILQKWYLSTSQYTISWRGFQSNDYLIFARDFHHAASSGHFLILKNNIAYARLVINRLGKVFGDN